jgi:hypothetical protein
VDKTQDSKRRHFSPHEKVAVVKRHLLERVPISVLCEEPKTNPALKGWAIIGSRYATTGMR